MSKIKDFIIDYFLEKNAFSPLEIDKNIHCDYLEASFLDSIEFVTLITELEEEFQINFTDIHLQSTEFRTIAGLIFISEKLAGGK